MTIGTETRDSSLVLHARNNEMDCKLFYDGSIHIHVTPCSANLLAFCQYHAISQLQSVIDVFERLIGTTCRDCKMMVSPCLEPHLNRLTASPFCILEAKQCLLWKKLSEANHIPEPIFNEIRDL